MGVVNVLDMDRLSHVVRRFIDLVGVCGAGGVMGFEHSAIVLSREGGARVRFVLRRRVGWVGVVSTLMGAEKAEPMSERVSERTCMRIEGARYGTWWDGEGGGRLMASGE